METAPITEVPALRETTMTDDHTVINTNPGTREEFETALTSLIEVAHTNGVDVENGIDLYHRKAVMPSWTIEITEINSPD